MRLGKFKKTPAEIKRYSISYEHWLDEGEYISTISFSVVSPSTGVLVVVPDVVAGNATNTQFFVSGGDAGQSYEVAATMATTGGQVKQDSIVFDVREL